MIGLPCVKPDEKHVLAAGSQVAAAMEYFVSSSAKVLLRKLKLESLWVQASVIRPQALTLKFVHPFVGRTNLAPLPRTVYVRPLIWAWSSGRRSGVGVATGAVATGWNQYCSSNPGSLPQALINVDWSSPGIVEGWVYAAAVAAGV